MVGDVLTPIWACICIFFAVGAALWQIFRAGPPNGQG